jgi:hypothetical protein
LSREQAKVAKLERQLEELRETLSEAGLYPITASMFVSGAASFCRLRPYATRPTLTQRNGNETARLQKHRPRKYRSRPLEARKMAGGQFKITTRTGDGLLAGTRAPIHVILVDKEGHQLVRARLPAFTSAATCHWSAGVCRSAALRAALCS